MASRYLHAGGLGVARHLATHFEIPTADSLFVRSRRRTIADAQAPFRFRGLAPGWYDVRAIVTWCAGTEMQGGVIGDSVLAIRGRQRQRSGRSARIAEFI